MGILPGHSLPNKGFGMGELIVPPPPSTEMVGVPLGLSIGAYDGVHLGHQQLLKRMVSRLKSQGLKTLVITFDISPSLWIRQKTEKSVLTLPAEKGMLMHRSGIDFIWSLHFDESIRTMEETVFLDQILAQGIIIKSYVCGIDHAFGHQKRGDLSFLRELTYQKKMDLWVEDLVEERQKKISSSGIRENLLYGEIGAANKQLGYYYFCTGQVISGDGLGRTFGFPTANLALPFTKLVPGDGVYRGAVYVWNAYYRAMIYVGKRPTVRDGHESRVEVYLYDFDDNLYDQEIRVFFIEKIRDECRFDNINALRHQIVQDVRACQHQPIDFQMLC